MLYWLGGPRADPGTRWRDCISWLAWGKLSVPLAELEELSGVREVWAFMLRRLSLGPKPR